MDVQELKDHLEFDVFGYIHPLTEKGEQYLVEHPELSDTKSVKERVDTMNYLVKHFENALGVASEATQILGKDRFLINISDIYDSFERVFYYLDERKQESEVSQLFVNTIFERFDEFIYKKGNFYKEEKAVIAFFHKKQTSGDKGVDIL